MASSTKLFDDLKSSYPWLAQLGLSMAWIQKTLAESPSAQEIVQEIRKTAQYKKRFPAIIGADGAMISSEAEYIQTEKDFRQLFKQFGLERNYATPESLKALFKNRVDPNELRDRLTVWRQVTSPEGKAFRDAFFVYTGGKLTERNLYAAAVDRGAWSKINADLISGALRGTYPQFIERATQVAIDRLSTRVDNWVNQGVLTDAAGRKLMSLDPRFAGQLMDSIATNGTGGMSQMLPLQDLLEAFENATLGMAAGEGGLAMPSKERLAEFRAAGVEKNRIIQGYRDFGRSQANIAAAVQRARGVGFGQHEFEQAEFLGSAGAARDLEAGFAYMEGIGRDQGNFRFTEQGGRISQRGFSNY